MLLFIYVVFDIVHNNYTYIFRCVNNIILVYNEIFTKLNSLKINLCFPYK